MNSVLEQLRDVLSAIDKGDRQALAKLGVADEDVQSLKEWGLVTIEPQMAISEVYPIEPDKSVESIAKLRRPVLTQKGKALLQILTFETKLGEENQTEEMDG